MTQNPESTQLTREDRENLRLLRTSRQHPTAESRLKQAMALALLELQTRLSTCVKTSGDR